MSKNPRVCVGYTFGDLHGERRHLSMSQTWTRRLWWVSELVIMNTTQFGLGFNKPPEAGGFDEVAGKNALIEECERTGCDWIVLCDPDEIVTEGLFDLIQVAHETGYDSVLTEHWHFITPWDYVLPPEGLTQGWCDPHVRAFQTSCGYRYKRNPNQEFMSQFANPTVHSLLDVDTDRLWRPQPGKYLHLHAKYLLDPDRPDWALQRPLVHPAEQEIVTVDVSPWPEGYVRAWINECEHARYHEPVGANN